MVLTVPEQLRLTFYRDRATGKLLSAFMKCGHQCLEAVVRTVVRQPVKIGTIVVVQTHGRSGHYNPHLHIIMTSGGINETTGKWVELGYFPYEIIHKKWQYDQPLPCFFVNFATEGQVGRLRGENWPEWTT
jgi:hypothetical protein